MSEEVFKAGIRWKLDYLKNKPFQEIIEFFRKMGLEPEYIGECDESLVLYTEEVGKLFPREENGEWYIEYIAVLDTNYEKTPFCVSLVEVQAANKEIVRMLFDAGYDDNPEYPVMFAYSWYTGVEEPFEEPKKVVIR